MDCKNYIRILHKMEDGKMYVCGTNAFDPECDYMVRQPLIHWFAFALLFCSTDCCLSLQSYENGQLTLEKKGEDGKGKCPFDPFQKYASIMIGEKWN